MKKENKMKLPFINRKRYIVLKCYTWHSGVLERSPIVLGDPEKVKPTPETDYLAARKSFATCWSRLATNKKSATICAPESLRFRCDENGVVQSNTPTDIMQVMYEHDNDQPYGLMKDFVIAKIMMPWHIEEQTGVNFVFARHMRNKTMMNVLSGVTNFKATCQINIFNAINKHKHHYEVPFNSQMVSLYPMSDLPLHVECYFDTAKHDELLQKTYNPFFSAGGIKKTKSGL